MADETKPQPQPPAPRPNPMPTSPPPGFVIYETRSGSGAGESK